jgi:NADH-quinone oxidoreductase subunit I
MVSELMKGLSITLTHFFKKPVTLKYPDVKMPMFPRFRGLHELHRYANGLERCVCCGLCAAVCPADAIYIDMLRCIFCGYCEEACPEDAIFLGHNYELSDYSRDSFVYTKEQLLVPVGVTHTPGIVRGR